MKADRTLLIVDDCPEDREIYRDYLSHDSQHTYRFIEASLAEAGLHEFRQQHCDAVLLDFDMPDMTGLEFLDQLHQSRVNLHPPVVMLTGHGNEAIAVRAMKQGAQDYLVKQHLQPDVLQLTVNNVIRQSSAQTLLSKTREHQRLIATTALRMRQSLDLEQVLNTAVAEVQQLLTCDHVGVYQCVAPSGLAKSVTVRAELGDRQTAPLGTTTSSGAAPAPALSAGLATDLVIPIVVLSQPQRHSVAQPQQVWGYLVAYRGAKGPAWLPEDRAIARDLSEQLAIAIQHATLLAQTQAAQQRAENISQLKSQVMAQVSAEYRPPLAAILGSANTLERHGDALTQAKSARLLQMIQTKARQMTQLVDDLLLVHECDFDQAQFLPMPMNLLQFLAELVEGHREQAGDRHQLTLQVAGKTQGFWGDPGILKFALSSLLGNAITYSPNGGPINITLAADTDSVTLTIQDHGIGIPPGEQAKIFQAFSRASNAGNLSGKGIGLAIAKACIELHGGSIALRSQLGQGTTAIITLPKEPEAAKKRLPPRVVVTVTIANHHRQSPSPVATDTTKAPRNQKDRHPPTGI